MAKERASLIETQYKDTCSKLQKENSEIKTENEQLRNNIEILKADTKENSEVFIKNSEKETMAWLQKSLKEEVKKKDQEIIGLKTHVIEYEREIAKLREKLKYIKEEKNKLAKSENSGLENENTWKETCVVFLHMNYEEKEIE